MREFEGTLRLQGIGIVEGIKAINLKVGDERVFNFGSTEKIIRIESNKTGKSVIVTCEYINEHARLEDGKWISEMQEDTRTIRNDTIIAVKELNPVQEEVKNNTELVAEYQSAKESFLNAKEGSQEEKDADTKITKLTLEIAERNIDLREYAVDVEVSIVETLRNETENIIKATKTQKIQEALQSINNQLDKVTNTINQNINDESVRLPLRDIENDLKWHYSSLSELAEEENNNSNSDILDLTGVNFNDINQLITFVSNWNEIPKNIQEEILKANNFYIYGTSLMLYVDSKAIAEAMIYITNNKIEIECIGFKGDLQWNQDDEPTETQQESNFKITIDGEGSRPKAEFNNFKKC